MATKLPDPGSIAALLSDRFQVSISATAGRTTEGAYIEVWPSDLDDNEGFKVRSLLRWRGVSVELRLGTFAADLLGQMARSSDEQRALFAGVARSMSEAGADISMSIDDVRITPWEVDTWPGEWKRFQLRVEKIPFMLDHTDETAVHEATTFWTSGVLAMVLALLPVEEVSPYEAMAGRGLPEGVREKVEVNRYERSRINRAMCISIHGTVCDVCGMEFHKTYGPIGIGFIHVHHRVPVSQLGPGYLVDPANDLIPVCANCHAMLHRVDPPLDPNHLRDLMIRSSESPSEK